MSAIHSRSSSCSGSSISMPLLEKEVDVKSGQERPPETPQISTQSEEYQFRIQLMNDSVTSSFPSLNSLSNVDDSPPPISPNSTAFDPIMRQGQVKIIRTGDTMHVLTLEDGMTPSITSYSKPLNPPWRPNSPRPRLDLSPLRSNFQFEGESAIQTISRYCFPNLSDSELENLTLQEILTEAQQIVSKWTATESDDCGLTEEQSTFLTDRFIQAKLETVLLKDWETLRDIFSCHHEWKLEQLMYEEPSAVVTEVNFKRSACRKSLPRVKPAKKRKEMLKEYDAFVDLGQKVDLRGLKRKRGAGSTFILSPDKIEGLLEKSQYYGRASGSPSKSKQKQKAIRSSRIFKTVKNSVKVSQSNSSSAVDKLNPRRDKPMAKIRSQVRKVDRLARLNGESFHEAALTLSKNSGLDSSKKLSSEREPLATSSQGPSSQETPQATTTTETDLDLGLGGVCFDADVNELTNSVMDGNVLEDLDNLVQNPGFNSTGNEPGNSMLKALHAGIGEEEEFVEQFGVPDIVSSMEDDGLLDLAITPTLDTDYDDVSSLMQPSPSTSKGDGEIFLMTGLSAAEHSAFDSLGEDLDKPNPLMAVVDKPKSQKAPGVKSAAAAVAVAEVKKTVEGPESNANQVSDVSDAKVDEEESQETEEENQETEQEKSNQDDNNVGDRRIKIERRSVRARRSAPAGGMTADETSQNPLDPKVSANKAQALLNCTLTGSYWQIPENKFPCNRPKRANAGALMTTKRTRNRGRAASESNKDSEKSSPTEPKKRAVRTAVRANSKVWHKKFISDGYNSPITPDGMVVTKKTALRCIVSIPDSICPTSHDEFLIKHRRYFGEEDIREVQELIGKARPKMEASNKKSGMDKYLKKLATRSKQGAAVTPEASDGIVVKTEEVAGANEIKNTEESSKEKSAASSSTSSVAAVVAPTAVAAAAPPPPVAPAKPAVVPTVPKPKAYSARSKRFEEDEKALIVKLEGNQILADGNLFVNINHENYVREKDVDIPYDDHEFSSSAAVEKAPEVATTEIKTDGEKAEEGQEKQKEEVKAEPEMGKSVCDTHRKLPHCVLGCVCGSIHPEDKGAGEREQQAKHCGKVKCMLECNCNSNNWNNEDADIRSRLRPRVSMLNWNTRLNLNYLDTYISPDKDKEFSSSKGDHRSVFSGHRLKRNIIAPKRNTDFISHNASKRLEAGRPLTRQATKMSPFKNIGSRLQRMKQRQQLLRPRHANEERLMRLKKGITGDSAKQSDKAGGRSKSGAISRQRGGYSDALSKAKKKLVPGVDYSLEGTGPMIPAELMARFAPFMEIRYRPKPDKFLPLQSESEEDSTDDEDMEEYGSLANLSYKFNQMASTSKPEESFAAPVIVSYRSCQDGLNNDIMYPTPSPVS